MKQNLVIPVSLLACSLLALIFIRISTGPEQSRHSARHQLEEQFGPLITILTEDDDSTITEINLDAQGLTDRTTFELLGTLSNLRHLTIRHGTFTDNDLSPLHSLTKLQSLQLQSLHFSGSGLKYLTQAKGLDSLTLSNNPSWDNANAHLLTELPLLQEIIFDYSPVDDVTLSKLKNHEKLRTIHLNNTQISFIGLQEFKKLKQLSHLAVSGCELGKNELNQLRELSTRQPLTLDLSQSTITNKDLAFMETLDVRQLNLNSTVISDAGLELIIQSKNCQQLDLGQTQCSAAALAQTLPALPLESLSLQAMLLNAEVLQSISNIETLTTLNLAESNLQDDWLPALNNCMALEHLILYRTNLSGEHLSKLAMPSGLSYLDLSHCPVTTWGIENLQSLHALTSLQLIGVQLESEGFQKLAQLPITHLNLSSSSLNRSNLEQLSSMANLREIIVRNCDISYQDFEMFQTRNINCVIYWQAYGLDSAYAVPEAMKVMTPRR